MQLTAGGYINLSLETFERVRIQIVYCEIIISIFYLFYKHFDSNNYVFNFQMFVNAFSFFTVLRSFSE